MFKTKISIMTTAIIAVAALAIGFLLGGVIPVFHKDSTPSISIDPTVDNATTGIGKIDGENIYDGNTYELPSEIVFTSAASSGVSVNLTAFVYPDNATNKAVDWSVSWEDSTNTSAVKDYLTIVPAEDGSTTATATCYKEFEGTILITVTTRDGGHKAICRVTFVGALNEVDLYNSYGKWSPEGIYYFDATKMETLELEIYLYNSFGQLDASEYSFTFDVKGLGTIQTRTKTVSQNGEVTWSGATATNNLASFTYGSKDYITVNLLPKTLEITLCPYNDFETEGSNSIYKDCLYFVDGAGFEITITEESTGLSKTIRAMFNDGQVLSVGLDNSTLVY